MNNNGHVLQYAPSALEFVECGPVFVKTVEYLGVNRVGGTHAFKVFVGLSFNGELVGMLAIKIGELAADSLHFAAFTRAFEQASPNYFKGLAGAHRLPD